MEGAIYIFFSAGITLLANVFLCIDLVHVFVSWLLRSNSDGRFYIFRFQHNRSTSLKNCGRCYIYIFFSVGIIIFLRVQYASMHLGLSELHVTENPLWPSLFCIAPELSYSLFYFYFPDELVHCNLFPFIYRIALKLN